MPQPDHDAGEKESISDVRLELVEKSLSSKTAAELKLPNAFIGEIASSQNVPRALNVTSFQTGSVFYSA